MPLRKKWIATSAVRKGLSFLYPADVGQCMHRKHITPMSPHMCLHFQTSAFLSQSIFTKPLNDRVEEQTLVVTVSLLTAPCQSKRYPSSLQKALCGSRDTTDTKLLCCQHCTCQLCFPLALGTAGFSQLLGIQFQLYVPICQSLWCGSALKQILCTHGVQTLAINLP